ncbi:hypothetical protein AGABI1DRAFT_110902 [Agaricus bisporus var. burnettii JB137-S8]|uniref:Uncharacterized protein n=2 Tax=Agaricus bisporus TaxID=5341 RepID=K5WBU8_AGABU|nr:uncharacterized protein AGABI1DRAFT_110902 [Agaricus bisporus var. burnettii JB137-S8]EKM84379.1 hypothetical protein AGABI1DRAFT_110902 [Agaricus bisporus var. burnettii JB137-S8]
MKFILFAATIIYTMIALVEASPAPAPQLGAAADSILGGLPVIGPIISPPPPEDG